MPASVTATPVSAEPASAAPAGIKRRVAASAVTRLLMVLALLAAACSSGATGTAGVSGSTQPADAGTIPDSDAGALNNTDDTDGAGDTLNKADTTPDDADGSDSNTISTSNDGDAVILLDPDDVTLTSRARLVAFNDCDSLLNHFHDEYSERADPWGLDNGIGVIGPMGGFGPVADVMADEAMAETAAPADAGSSSRRSNAVAPIEGVDFSGTNVQEADVDEADIIKTDGRRIYTLSSGLLVVVDAADRARISEIRVADGWGYELFINGDSLLLITQSYNESTNDGRGGNQTVLQHIDVTDGVADIVETLTVQGSYVSARSVDGTARVVLRYDPQWEFPFVYPQNESAYESAESANRAAILETTLDDWLPHYTTESGGDPSRGSLMLPCGAVHAPRVFSGFGITSVLSVVIGEPFDPSRSTAVTAASSIVYASAASLYVATNRWESSDVIKTGDFSSDEDFWRDHLTYVHRFDISGDEASYEASGEVQGVIRNQFSMSEHDGHLRIVTTTGDFWGERSESQVRVLETSGSALREVGSVGDIGRGENVQSVRFVGDVGYVVTFRQIDPFYTIDLSDPADPRILGELKIPGFSSYLHPVSDTMILGVGSDADLNGRVTGAKVSLFDVSDLSAPAEVAVWSAPDGWNDIGWDHRAFLWWAPEQLAVLPVSITAGRLGDWWAGAVLLRVDGGAITEAGRIDHEIPREEPGRTDCRRITESDLPSTGDGGATTELQYIVTEDYSAVLACREGQGGMTGFECHPEPRLDSEGARLGLLLSGESVSICWPNYLPDLISRSMVIGDELWTLSHKGWGSFNGSQQARLQVNDLRRLERLAALALP
ncbi:MAG: beta-propeller domain-containing protein [Acidimicrobiaceae bacterium]|nr:beta-propeller domain-containing protein [Acidimicrobiaceae bacterium]MCY4294680.1 beta-propeller domain-containing protein [Acidimicrobiaceae bacterium]